MIRGVDVSRYQLVIDWAKLASVDRFAIPKATEGTTVDPYFALNWARSKGKLPRSAYLFFHPEIDGAAQATALIARLDGDIGEFGPCVDVEAPSSAWSALWRANLKTCLETLERELHRIPIVYTAQWYIGYVGDAPWLAMYPLWVASYTLAPVIPKPWLTWLFWQTTSKGDPAAHGCQGNGMDLDLFNGDEAAFQRFIGKEITTMTKVRVTIGTQTADLDTPFDIHVADVPVATTDVWTANFYNGVALAGPVLDTTTYPGPALNVNWGAGSPTPKVPIDNFSATFTMTHTFTAGAWQWSVNSDDGFRLYVDGVIVPGLDGWIQQSAASKTYNGHVTLTAGVHTVKVEYMEMGGNAEFHASAPIPF